jgi:hypothetical protein
MSNGTSTGHRNINLVNGLQATLGTPTARLWPASARSDGDGYPLFCIGGGAVTVVFAGGTTAWCHLQQQLGRPSYDTVQAQKQVPFYNATV